MAANSRYDRPVRRGRVDDTGGEGDRGEKLYYHLTLLAETDDGLPQPDQALLGGLPRGLLLQAPARLGAARALPRGAHRDDRLPRRRRAPGAARTTTSTRRRRSPARLQDIFGRDNLFVELQDHGLAEQRRTNPRLIEIAKRDRRAARRDQRQPLLPARGRRRARRAALRADRRDDRRPEALQVRRRGALPQDARPRCASCSPSSPRPATTRFWIAERADVEIELGKPTLPEFPVPEQLRGATTTTTSADGLPAPPHLRGRRASATATPLPPRSSSGSTTSSASSSTMGFSAYFLVVWDLIRHAREHGSASARAAARRRAAASPTACASSTSTRSATTCSSSAS